MHQTQTCIFRSIHNYHFIVDTSINDIISLCFITWSSWDFHILIVEHHIRSFMTSCHRARKWCLPGKPVVSNMKVSCQENILNVFEQTITKSFLHSFFQFCWCFKCSMVVFNSFQTRKKKTKKQTPFSGCKKEFLFENHIEAKSMTPKKPSSITSFEKHPTGCNEVIQFVDQWILGKFHVNSLFFAYPKKRFHGRWNGSVLIQKTHHFHPHPLVKTARKISPHPLAATQTLLIFDDFAPSLRVGDRGSFPAK